MTSNQIAFAVYKENKRHNLKNERIGESNVALGYANLNEMFRHNYASEDINQQLADTKGQEADTHAEQVRVNAYNAETQRRKLIYDAFGGFKRAGKPIVAAGYAIADWMDSVRTNPDEFLANSAKRQAGVVK